MLCYKLFSFDYVFKVYSLCNFKILLSLSSGHRKTTVRNFSLDMFHCTHDRQRDYKGPYGHPECKESHECRVRFGNELTVCEHW